MRRARWIDRCLGIGARWLPRPAQAIAARCFDRITDLLEGTSVRGAERIPPLRLRLHAGPFYDPALFRASAQKNLVGLEELGGLRPTSDLLDLGCGPGRMAGVLVRYLDPSARYEGIDVAEGPVRWCARTISPGHPGFRFTWWDVASQRYHPSGRVAPRSAMLPYGDESFDLVYAGSLFTHLEPEGIAQTLREVRRVLRPDGVLFATFCLLTADSLPVVRAGESEPPLPFDLGACRVRDPNDPTDFIAVPEQRVREWMTAAGLALTGPIRFGPWAAPAGPRDEMSTRFGYNQDLVTARRTEAIHRSHVGGREDGRPAPSDGTDPRPGPINRAG